MNHKRILITGDAGRGKTALANKLSQKLNIKLYSTDDYFWKTKYSQMADKKKSINKLGKIYTSDSWIVEGSTRHLIKEGLDKADQIIILGYRNILFQFWTLYQRSKGRKEEGVVKLLLLCKHVFFKRYGLGNQRGKVKLDDLLSPYTAKVVRLNSFKEIDNFIDNL